MFGDKLEFKELFFILIKEKYFFLKINQRRRIICMIFGLEW